MTYQDSNRGPSARAATAALLLTGALLLLQACSNARLTTDHDPSYDFTRLHVWDWASQSEHLQTPAAVKTSDRIHLDSLVRRRVEGLLLQKGYTHDRTTADFLVEWSFGEWQLERRANAGSKYGAVGLYYPGFHASGTHQSADGRALPPAADPYSSNEEEAKLDLVIIDAKTRRVIWHGNVTDQSDFGYYRSAQTDEVRAAVASILDSFPPAP